VSQQRRLNLNARQPTTDGAEAINCDPPGFVRGRQQILSFSNEQTRGVARTAL
jgi:hypothetical protein